MADVTFRDFAGAIMRADVDAAGVVLQTLLALSPEAASKAARHFQTQSAVQGPAFMGQAMGLRTAVAGGNDGEIGGLLASCFGLGGDTLTAAVEAIKRTSGARPA